MSSLSLRRIEWPTLAVMLGTYMLFGFGTSLWHSAPVFSVILTAIAIAQFGSLQHEVLHGHPFQWPWLNEALVFPSLFLALPYRRFQETHLAHHHDPSLTDPYDDPESNYCDPAIWARLPRPIQIILRINNYLAGRLVIGPLIGSFMFLRAEIVGLLSGQRNYWIAWALNTLGLIPLILWLSAVQMPFLPYLGAVYLALSLLRLRTFLEHRAHSQHRARTVIIEDRGPLSLLYLNNNFHVVHHMHPNVPWYDLPALYHARKNHFQRRNEGYVYRSYGQIIRQYMWRSKDPVPHPVWPVNKSELLTDAEKPISDQNYQKTAPHFADVLQQGR
jgi:fatty acid desaturase